MTCGALGEARVSSVVGREVRGWRVWGCWLRLAFIPLQLRFAGLLSYLAIEKSFLIRSRDISRRGEVIICSSPIGSNTRG
jgi:hypothetical protein